MVAEPGLFMAFFFLRGGFACILQNSDFVSYTRHTDMYKHTYIMLLYIYRDNLMCEIELLKQSTSIIVLKEQCNPKMKCMSFMLFQSHIYSSVKYMDWAN